jgi:hypothetical protein
LVIYKNLYISIYILILHILKIIMLSKEYYINELKKKFNTNLNHMLCWFIGSGIFAGCMLKYNFHRQFYEQDPNLSYYSTNSDIVSDTNLYIINIIPVCCVLI